MPSPRYQIVWRAVATPTPFMDAKFRPIIRYFARESRAFAWARAYCATNRFGKVTVSQKPRRGTR